MDASNSQLALKVSVIIMTYNHIHFIRQAIDSALEQHTNFAYEILISEDCSTDGTREVVLAYHQQHPDRIRLILSETNIRNNMVVMRAVEAARGEYIALLDGDDCWSSPHKLQKQVNFLDQHPECSMCFHNAQAVFEDEAREPRNWTPKNQPEISTFEDIWMGNFIATCSCMFRKAALGTIPDWYRSMFPITDWPLHILNAERGKIGYIDEVMGIYRQHPGGYYSPLSEAQKQAKTLDFYRTMNANLRYKYDTLVKIAISKYFFEWAEEYANIGRFEQARTCFRTCLTGRPVNRYISAKRLLRVGVKLYLAR